MKKNCLTQKEREIRRFRLTMLLPGILVLFIINFWPILDTFRTSLFDYYLPRQNLKTFIGFDNYVALFRDERFVESLIRTVFFVLAVVAVETLIGFILALVLTSKFYGEKLLRGVLMLPIMLTPITAAFMWRIMFSPTLGVLNYFLSLFGIGPQKWVYGSEQALLSIGMVLTWCKVPFMVMVFYTGLLSISDDILDAAMIDGANYWQTLFRIKLPLIKPVFFVAVLFQIIDTAKEFDFTQILTRGGPGSASETLSIYTYLTSFGFLKMGYGSASAIILSVIICLMAVIIIKIGGISFDR